MGLKQIDLPLLSHQPKDEKYKCLQLTLLNHQLLLCSRCAGLYVGFATGAWLLWAQPFYLSAYTAEMLIIFLPAIAFADWMATKIWNNQGNNWRRVLSGFCLGVATAIILQRALTFKITLIDIASPALYAIVWFLVSSITQKVKCDSNRFNH